MCESLTEGARVTASVCGGRWSERGPLIYSRGSELDIFETDYQFSVKLAVRVYEVINYLHCEFHSCTLAGS